MNEDINVLDADLKATLLIGKKVSLWPVVN